MDIDKAWNRRLKREDCRNYASKNPQLELRAVKNHYEYTLNDKKKAHETIEVDAIYLTNLSKEKFDTAEIVSLYHTRRWDHETAYFDIKSHLEAERFNSGKYNIVVNELYGKILCYSICGLIYNKVCDNVIKSRQENPSNKYEYLPNMKYLCDTVRLEYKFLQYLSLINSYASELEAYIETLIEECSKKLVPIRPGRHYKRWGRWMSSMPDSKFRVDGRRNPLIKKCFTTNGYMTTNR